MWPRLRTLILIVSGSLNVAFLFVWLVGVVPRWVQQEERPAVVQGQGEVWSSLHREIGVTPDQWQAIEPILLKFQKESLEQRKVIATLRSQVIDLLASPDATRGEIRAKQDQILSAMRRMQDLVIAHYLEEKVLLGPEQQEKLFEIARRNSLGKVLSLEKSEIMSSCPQGK